MSNIHVLKICLHCLKCKLSSVSFFILLFYKSDSHFVQRLPYECTGCLKIVDILYDNNNLLNNKKNIVICGIHLSISKL